MDSPIDREIRDHLSITNHDFGKMTVLSMKITIEIEPKLDLFLSLMISSLFLSIVRRPCDETK